jgi:hypothetical protein
LQPDAKTPGPVVVRGRNAIKFTGNYSALEEVLPPFPLPLLPLLPFPFPLFPPPLPFP